MMSVPTPGSGTKTHRFALRFGPSVRSGWWDPILDWTSAHGRRGFLWSGSLDMSKAMEAIVGGYVKLADRGALEGLKSHHGLLLKELASRSGVQLGLNAPMVQMIDEELAIIEAGLQKLPAFQR